MPELSPEVVLGFDFGLKRMGVAVGQVVTQTATPLAILEMDRGIPNWDTIGALIAEWQAQAVIVGLPLNMDGTEQPITRRARAFGNSLKKHFHLPVFFVDERLTTVAAREIMHAQKKGDARFAKVDSVSAQLIVESWFKDRC